MAKFDHKNGHNPKVTFGHKFALIILSQEYSSDLILILCFLRNSYFCTRARSNKNYSWPNEPCWIEYWFLEKLPGNSSDYNADLRVTCSVFLRVKKVPPPISKIKSLSWLVVPLGLTTAAWKYLSWLKKRYAMTGNMVQINLLEYANTVSSCCNISSTKRYPRSAGVKTTRFWKAFQEMFRFSRNV